MVNGRPDRQVRVEDMICVKLHDAARLEAGERRPCATSRDRRESYWVGSSFKSMCRALRCQNPSWTYGSLALGQFVQ